MVVLFEKKKEFKLQRGKVIIRPTVTSDFVYLKDRLRAEDVQEIKASTGETPEQALATSIKASSFCATVLHEGKPVAVFGTAPITDHPDKAGVWFLASDDLKGMWLSFLKMSKMCIERMLDGYPYLFNYVDARNESSLLWLKWCGAEIYKPQPMGPEKRPFHFFTFKRRILHV